MRREGVLSMSQITKGAEKGRKCGKPSSEKQDMLGIHAALLFAAHAKYVCLISKPKNDKIRNLAQM